MLSGVFSAFRGAIYSFRISSCTAWLLVAFPHGEFHTDTAIWSGRCFEFGLDVSRVYTTRSRITFYSTRSRWLRPLSSALWIRYSQNRTDQWSRDSCILTGCFDPVGYELFLRLAPMLIILSYHRHGYIWWALMRFSDFCSSVSGSPREFSSKTVRLHILKLFACLQVCHVFEKS